MTNTDGPAIKTTATNIDPLYSPVLVPWLRKAAVGIAVIEIEGALLTPWWVEVHNDVEGDGDAHQGTIIARCTTQMEAELVASALWALLRERVE